MLSGGEAVLTGGSSLLGGTLAVYRKEYRELKVTETMVGQRDLNTKIKKPPFSCLVNTVLLKTRIQSVVHAP